MRLIPVLMIAFALVVLISCGKDKFETTPVIELKDFSTKVIPKNGSLVIRLNYFDKEGDIANGQLFLYRQRTNKLPPSSLTDRNDTLFYSLPEYVDKDRGEIRVELQSIDFLSESVTANDTMYFRFALTDRAGHTSDTLNTTSVVQLFQ